MSQNLNPGYTAYNARLLRDVWHPHDDLMHSMCVYSETPSYNVIRHRHIDFPFHRWSATSKSTKVKPSCHHDGVRKYHAEGRERVATVIWRHVRVVTLWLGTGIMSLGKTE